MAEKIAERRLLSKLVIIKSDLENINPKDFDEETEKIIMNKKENVEFLVNKLIPKVKGEI